MMPFKKIFLLLTLVFFLIIAHHSLTDGFKVSKIISTKVIGEKRCGDVFGKFVYMGRGRQCYVFENGNYVLKLVRMHKYAKPFFYKENTRVRREREEREKRAFESYKIAFEKLDCQLVAFHLSHLGNCKKIHLVDKLGRDFHLDSSKFVFLIQRKGKPFDKELKKRIENCDVEGAKKLISSFIEMVAKRAKLHIANRDFMNALRNDGIYQEKVFEMDVGSFYYDDGEFFNKEVAILEKFVSKLAPEFLDFIKREECALSL